MAPQAVPLRRQTRSQAAATPAAAAVSFLIRSAQQLSASSAGPNTAHEGQELGPPTAIIAAHLCRRAVKVAAVKDTPLPRGIASQICRGCALPLSGAGRLASVEVIKLSRTQRRRQGRKSGTQDRAAPQGSSRRRNTVILRRVCSICGFKNENAFFTEEAAYQVAGIQKPTGTGVASKPDSCEAPAAAASCQVSTLLKAKENASVLASIPLEKTQTCPTDNTQSICEAEEQTSALPPSPGAREGDDLPVILPRAPEAPTAAGERQSDIDTTQPQVRSTPVSSAHGAGTGSPLQLQQGDREEQHATEAWDSSVMARPSELTAVEEQTNFGKVTECSPMEILRLGGSKDELTASAIPENDETKRWSHSEKETALLDAWPPDVVPVPPLRAVPAHLKAQNGTESAPHVQAAASAAAQHGDAELTAIENVIGGEEAADGTTLAADRQPQTQPQSQPEPQPQPPQGPSGCSQSEPEHQAHQLNPHRLITCKEYGPSTPPEAGTSSERAALGVAACDLTGPQSASELMPASTVDYAKMTTAQLKSHLRRRALKIGGLKAELVQRLEDSDLLRALGGVSEDESHGGGSWSKRLLDGSMGSTDNGTLPAQAGVTTADDAVVAPLAGISLPTGSHWQASDTGDSPQGQHTMELSQPSKTSQVMLTDEANGQLAENSGSGELPAAAQRSVDADGPVHPPTVSPSHLSGGRPYIQAPEARTGAHADLSCSPRVTASAAPCVDSHEQSAPQTGGPDHDGLSPEVGDNASVLATAPQPSDMEAISGPPSSPSQSASLPPPAGSSEESPHVAASHAPSDQSAGKQLWHPVVEDFEGLEVGLTSGQAPYSAKRPRSGDSQHVESQEGGSGAEGDSSMALMSNGGADAELCQAKVPPGDGAADTSRHRPVSWNTIGGGWMRLGRSWWPMAKRRRVARGPKSLHPSVAASFSGKPKSASMADILLLQKGGAAGYGQPIQGDDRLIEQSHRCGDSESHSIKASQPNSTEPLPAALPKPSIRLKEKNLRHPANWELHKSRAAFILGVTHNFRRQKLLADLLHRI